MFRPGVLAGPVTLAVAALLRTLRVSCVFKRQRHVAQVTLGLDQYQWARFNGHHRGPLAWHVDWARLCGHGGLRFSDLAGVGIDPLQT